MDERLKNEGVIKRCFLNDVRSSAMKAEELLNRFDELKRERMKLDRELDKVEFQVIRLVNKETGNFRVRQEKLIDVIHKVVPKGKKLTAPEVANLCLKGGYRTRNRNFVNTVGWELRKNKEFKRVDRGHFIYHTPVKKVKAKVAS